MRIRVLQRQASYVRVNLGHWGSEGQEGEIKKVIMLTVRRRCIIIVCHIHTCGPCEDQRRSVGVKVYGSRQPVSKRTRDIGVAKIQKERQTSRVSQPWGQRDGGEGRHLEPGGIRD